MYINEYFFGNRSKTYIKITNDMIFAYGTKVKAGAVGVVDDWEMLTIPAFYTNICVKDQTSYARVGDIPYGSFEVISSVEFDQINKKELQTRLVSLLSIKGSLNDD